MAESWGDAQIRILERMASTAPLGEVLDLLLRAIEVQAPGVRATIMLLDDDGSRLHTASAPSLPESFVRDADNVPLGPAAGSCGTAAFRGERVVSADITTDPIWDSYRELALSYGLRAAWSTPIRSADGTLLGTVAVYHGEPREPTPGELELVDAAANLAKVAIERHGPHRKLRERETTQRVILDSSLDALIGMDEAGL